MPTTLTPRNVEARGLGAGPPQLTELIGGLARAAARITSGRSAATVLMFAPDRERELLCSASDPYAATMTCLQHEFGEGPYPDALAEARSVAVHDVTTEVWRWPMLALAARGHGLAAAHAEPLIRPGGELLGVIIWYADAPGPIGAERCGGLPAQAREVTHTLALATRLLDLGLGPGELPAALRARRVLSQAVGVLMQREACDADTAFARLREEARLHRTAVHTVAAVLVDRAARPITRG